MFPCNATQPGSREKMQCWKVGKMGKRQTLPCLCQNVIFIKRNVWREFVLGPCLRYKSSAHLSFMESLLSEKLLNFIADKQEGTGFISWLEFSLLWLGNIF